MIEEIKKCPHCIGDCVLDDLARQTPNCFETEFINKKEGVFDRFPRCKNLDSILQRELKLYLENGFTFENAPKVKIDIPQGERFTISPVHKKMKVKQYLEEYGLERQYWPAAHRMINILAEFHLKTPELDVNNETLFLEKASDIALFFNLTDEIFEEIVLVTNLVFDEFLKLP